YTFFAQRGGELTASTTKLDDGSPGKIARGVRFARGTIEDMHHVLTALDAPDADLRVSPDRVARKFEEAAMRHRPKTVAIIGAGDSGISSTNPCGPFEHRVEHRREIGRRRVDNLHYLAHGIFSSLRLP